MMVMMMMMMIIIITEICENNFWGHVLISFIGPFNGLHNVVFLLY